LMITYTACFDLLFGFSSGIGFPMAEEMPTGGEHRGQ
jgi:hypothetical protein